MKHLLIAVPYGLAFRTLVGAGVLGHLVDRGARATLLLPHLDPADLEIVERELPSNVAIEPLMRPKSSLPFTTLKFLKQHFYGRRTSLASFEVKAKFRRRHQPIFHIVASAAERLAETLSSEDRIDRWLEAARQDFEQYYVDRIRDWGVDAVVLTKPGYHPDELPLIKAARRLGRPSLAFDTTWDNMVSKRPAYLRVDGLTAWNAQMAAQAVEHYRLDAGRVPVTGGAQFDVFFEPPPPRDAFLESLGLDPARRVIVFTLNNPSVTPGNDEYISQVVAAIGDGRIAGQPSLVVRTHPWDRDNDYRSSLAGHPSARLERSFTPPREATVFECLGTRADVQHYGALMRHADLLLNIASTTSLDGIAADVPVVNLAFDAIPVHPDASVARYCEYTHYKPILATGAVRVARSFEELCRMASRDLADPTVDADARAAARASFLTYTDGSAAGRVAEALLAMC